MSARVHQSPGINSTGINSARINSSGINRFLLTTSAVLTTRATLAGLACVAVLASAPGHANPLGASVPAGGGSGTIQGQGTNSVTINQSSQNLIINWNTFDIGKGETTTFNQTMGSSSVALNRVIGGHGPSSLDGTLTANGHVFIVNGDGILFGPNSSINAAGFLATTHNISDADFLAGKYNFNIPGNPNASIVNLGSITAASGGFAALVAPGVRNAGTITATLGTVSLAAGNAFTLDFYGDRLITLAVTDQIASVARDVQTGETLKSLVSNTGKLSANGGRVELTAAAARAVVDSVINNKGVIEANSVGTRNGMIVLRAATGASKPAGAPTQTIALSGKISAAGKDKGTKGGTVVVTGENIVLSGASIDASGDAGGGKVLIGGDTGGGHPSPAAANLELAKLESFVIPTATTVSVDGASVINTSATGQGGGGKVVLWSDQQTTFAGTILARGGASGGDGGFVETSGHQNLLYTGAVELSAPKGQVGTALLDPSAGVIDATCSSLSSCITTSAIQAGLGSANFIVTTDSGNITVDSNVNLTWGANTLTLSAFNNIVFQTGALMTNTGAGSLVLRADNTGTATGTSNGKVIFGSGTQINFSGSTGTVSIYYDPTCDCTGTKYQNPRDAYFAQHVTGNFTAYMLVNNAGDLQLMGANLRSGPIVGNFALGKSFSAAPGDGFTGFTNIGTTFAGLFDGNGGLGTNYTISNLNLTAPFNDGQGNSFGLFPFINSTGIVRNLNLANVTIAGGDNLYFLGAVAGDNSGTISNVHVLSGNLNGSTFTGIGAGGLVGQNEGTGVVSGSSANVMVTVGDAPDASNLNFAAGLVASNLGSITNSSATGNVSGGAFSYVGGLVGQNGLFCDCNGPTGPGTIALSFATGNVSVGNNGVAGGLLATNNGGSPTSSSVTQSYATGNVNGAGNVQLGGFVGANDSGATIANSYATGNVTGTNLVSGSGSGNVATAAGFAGKNGGTITNSFATGNVSATGATFGDFVAGGFVGVNNRGGLIQGTPAQSQFAYATGSVTGSANSVAGGFAGQNGGMIKFAYASGAVHVGSSSYAGGFVAGNSGSIFQAFATGAVTDDGNTVLGGFGAFNIGALEQVFATGAVTGGTNTVVGGLVAVNAALAPSTKFGSPGPVGSIKDSYATGKASGGSGSVVAGLVAVNDGVVKTSYSAGAVSGGSTGGLVAKNNSSFQFADLAIPSIVDQGGSPVPLQPGSGTITNSYWNSETSGQSSSAGGTGMTSKQLASGLPAGFDPAVWTILPDPSFPFFPWAPVSTIPNIVLPPVTPTNLNTPPLTQIINNLTGGLTLVSLPASVTVLPYPAPPPGPSFGPGPQLGGEPRLFAIPPRGETRFVKDEVLLMVDCDTPQSALDTIAREMRLTITGSQCLMQTHLNLLRLHINSGQSVAEVIRTLARYRIIALAQVNFIYHTMQERLAQQNPAQERVAQDLAQDPGLAGRTQEGDSAQYALGKLGVIDIHRLIKGTNIPIAVIDSQIDTHHPDLEGVFADQYDAVGGAAEMPHPHGTGMAGAISAHQRLMGIAPAARLYAIHAFSSNAASADSTTFNILKGLDWASSKGVRVINMSFAGPRDPSMERALKAAHDKGIVLIAAAGNAGPKSPPLFPGADPNVIAVTATDANDKLFTGANRGRYIAVAAPGVDILVPAPDNTYQLTTGTSVSSAEVSGIAALLLERNPNLGPEDIRKILTTSAKHPGTKERDDDFGSGLVDPSKAIQDAGELKPVGQPAKR
jgi:filamentous hemagglutinin family protein